MALSALLVGAMPAAAASCTVFRPNGCWFLVPPPSEEPLLLPRCGRQACDFEQSALECPFFSSGSYETVETDDCEPFMRVRAGPRAQGLATRKLPNLFSAHSRRSTSPGSSLIHVVV